MKSFPKFENKQKNFRNKYAIKSKLKIIFEQYLKDRMSKSINLNIRIQNFNKKYFIKVNNSL
jgi:hypothetical protein